MNFSHMTTKILNRYYAFRRKYPNLFLKGSLIWLRPLLTFILELVTLNRGCKIKLANTWPLRVEWKRIVDGQDLTEWERDFRYIYSKNLLPNDVVFDLGTESGETAVLAATRIGGSQVHMFEPNRASWRHIRKIWRYNRSDAPGGCWPGFVSNRTSNTKFNSKDLVLWPQVDRKKPAHCENLLDNTNIPSITIDDYVKISGAKPTVLFMDIEGAEVLALESAVVTLSTLKPLIFLSYHPTMVLQFDRKPETAMEFLSSLGYKSHFISIDHEEHWIFYDPQRRIPTIEEAKSKNSLYQTSDITFFTIPKPFIGHIDVIQRNAIKSWMELGSQVILCGNEFGTERIASEFGIKHIPDVARNKYGTPLVNSVFKKVETASHSKLLCYVNTDIVFLSDFKKALECINLEKFLMAGLRIDINLEKPIDFKLAGWETSLKKLALADGNLYKMGGMDYFLFTPDSQLSQMPSFIVGRPHWDNWFIYNARLHDIPLIDSTQFVRAIHQSHGYSHVPKREENTNWEGPEAEENKKLSDYGFLTLEHAEYLLSKDGRVEKVTDRVKQSDCFLRLGASFRKRDKKKALRHYLRSLSYRGNPKALTAIVKLFIPGYYRWREW